MSRSALVRAERRVEIALRRAVRAPSPTRDRPARARNPLRRRAFRQWPTAASRPTGAVARAAGRPGSWKSAVRQPPRRRSARPGHRRSERPAAWCRRSRWSTTTCRRRSPPDPPTHRPIGSTQSLRGDHSTTTTGTSLDRASTSASKFVSVISTPACAPAVRPVSLLCVARCLRAERSTAPAMAGATGGRGRVTWSSLSRRPRRRCSRLHPVRPVI